MNLVQQRRKRQKDKNRPSLCNFVRDNIAASREGAIGGKSGQKKLARHKLCDVNGNLEDATLLSSGSRRASTMFSLVFVL